MTEKFEDRFGTDGWILSLKKQPDSDWGSVVKFYESMYEDMEGERGRTQATWESTFRGHPEGKGPRKGQGIAFYHNSRAEFPPGTPNGQKLRISLIGKLARVKICDKKIEYIEAIYQKDVLKALKRLPIIRDDSTIHLFEGCRMVRGNVASFYYAPPDVWMQFLGILKQRLER